MENPSDSSKRSFFRHFKHFESRHLYVLLLSVFVIFATIFSYYYERRQDLSVGDIVPYDLSSPVTVPYYNRIKTEELRQKAEENVPIIYRKNPLIFNAIKEELDFLYKAVQAERRVASKNLQEKILEITKHLGSNANASQVAGFLLQADDSNLELVFSSINQIMATILDKGLQEADLADISIIIDKRIQESTLAEALRLPVIAIATQKIRSNMSIDEDATNRQKEEARQKIVPVRETIIQNEIIVEKGKPITPETYDKLLAVGRIGENQLWQEALKAMIYALLILLMLLLFLLLQNTKHPTQENWKKYLLLFSLVSLFMLLVRFIAPLNQFLIPVFIFAILIRVFFEPALSFYFVAVLTLFSLHLFGVDYLLISSYLLSSMLAMVFYSRLKTFTDFLVKSFYSSAALALLTFLLLCYLPESIFYNSKLIITSLLFFNGLIASLLSLGIVVLLGYYADFVTPLRLFELSDPNSPLLRKLFETAPGTYQHSIMIANLASHAADAIGADPLFARVGSYYHDIGKTISPLSFTENSSGKNLLDEMEPMEAVKVIKSHVEYGLILAKKYRLPSCIHRFISSHHGDNRISFMYESAKKTDKSIIDDRDFRYPGPKPILKEVSIVMLADSVEAAVRSLEEKTQENLEEMVSKIIDNKINSNQLNDSELTFSDLQIIKHSFLFTLDSLYHVRLSYPPAPAGSSSS
jgi:cyclic-di-AMP phosphodiesterase PgpH